MIGDSKSTPGGHWPDMLLADLNYSVEPGWVMYNTSQAGRSVVSNNPADITAILATVNPAETVTQVYVSLGINDINPLADETAWKTAYLVILDAIHAKWPSATVRLSKVWMSGEDTDADTMAGWFDWLVAERPTFTAIGDDERVWFKPNVATYSDDGGHYNDAGHRAAARIRKTGLGY